VSSVPVLAPDVCAYQREGERGRERGRERERARYTRARTHANTHTTTITTTTTTTREDDLIDPVPDEATLQDAVGVDDAPILGDAAARVAHGVRVLTHDQRPRARVQLVARGVCLELGWRGVHGSVDVGVVVDRLQALRVPHGLQARVFVLHDLACSGKSAVSHTHYTKTP